MGGLAGLAAGCPRTGGIRELWDRRAALGGTCFVRMIAQMGRARTVIAYDDDRRGGGLMLQSHVWGRQLRGASTRPKSGLRRCRPPPLDTIHSDLPTSEFFFGAQNERAKSSPARRDSRIVMLICCARRRRHIRRMKPDTVTPPKLLFRHIFRIVAQTNYIA